MSEDKDGLIARRVSQKDKNGELVFYGWLIECPACKEGHLFDSRWKFNGDQKKPTFTPSMLIRGTQPITDEEHKLIMSGGKFEPKKRVCHSFVTDGKIRFLGDCTHDLKNQTVELKEF